MRFAGHWILAMAAGLAVAACSGQSSALPTPPEVIKQLGFDPSTLSASIKGADGKPALPAGLTYRDLVPAHKYDDPDQVVVDPAGKYLFFITHLQYPDGSVYRIDLASGETVRLTTGLQRLGGMFYYQPGNVVLVAEEGTGVGPEENNQGFWHSVHPDVVDQPTPPPLKAMGQYRGEGMEMLAPVELYMTEDQPRGGHLYKFVPDRAPDLTSGTLYTFHEQKGFMKTAYLKSPDTGKEGTPYFGAEGLHKGPDGMLYMAISAETEDRILRVDPKTGKVSNFVTTKAPGAKGVTKPDTIGFAPNGVLFFTGGGGNIYAALPSTTPDGLSAGVYHFATGLDTADGIAWSPDYNTLYLSGRGDADIIIAVSGFKR